MEFSKHNGVGIPFNGTRRWYMSVYHKAAEAVYSTDYLDQVLAGMHRVIGWMFADGIQSVYTPIIGHALAERGEAYMQFGMAAVAHTVTPAAIEWHIAHQANIGFYGDMEILPAEIQAKISAGQQHINRESHPHTLYYGLFADRPLQKIMRRSVALHQQLGRLPTDDELIRDYYGGEAAPLDIWIGSDQPTVYDVPLVMHGSTALYFLQYPTLFMTQEAWKRILHDAVHVRGDDETLYPDNLTPERSIMGLGVRDEGGWKAVSG